jgi:hypothetical protein
MSGIQRTSEASLPKTRRQKRRPNSRILVVLKLPPEVYKRVKAVMRTRKLSSVQDVFRHGFLLLENVTKYESEGWYVNLLLTGEKKKAVVSIDLKYKH